MAKVKEKEKPANNIQFEVDGSTLTITVDLEEELRESSSGFSTIVADTGNFIAIPNDDDEDNSYGIKMIVTKRAKKKKKEK